MARVRFNIQKVQLHNFENYEISISLLANISKGSNIFCRLWSVLSFSEIICKNYVSTGGNYRTVITVYLVVPLPTKKAKISSKYDVRLNTGEFL